MYPEAVPLNAHAPIVEVLVILAGKVAVVAELLEGQQTLTCGVW